MTPEDMMKRIQEETLTAGPKELFFNPVNLRAVPLSRADAQRDDIIRNRIPGTDIDLGIRYVITSDEKGMMSYMVKPEHLSGFMMTEQEAIQRALINSEKTETIEIAPLWQKLGLPFGMETEPTLYVVTNATGMYGASTIAMPSVMKEVSEKFDGKQFYVLPSSIHEVLCCEAAGMDPQELQEIVHAVNAAEVAPEDQMSESVFLYDGNALSIAAGEDLDEFASMEDVMSSLEEMDNAASMHM